MFSAQDVALLRSASPDRAVLAGTFGVLLIFVEMNRPGRFWAGTLGLLLVLLATGRLFTLGVQPRSACAAGLVAGCFLLNLYRPIPPALLGAATVGAVLALRFLLRPSSPAHVHTWYAVVCGCLLGLVSTALTRIAYRARRAKALN